MNFLIGVVLIGLLSASPVKQTVVPVIASFEDYATVNGENGLQAGDRIVEVDGEKLYSYSRFLHDPVTERRRRCTTSRCAGTAKRSF